MKPEQNLTDIPEPESPRLSLPEVVARDSVASIPAVAAGIVFESGREVWFGPGAWFVEGAPPELVIPPDEEF